MLVGVTFLAHRVGGSTNLSVEISVEQQHGADESMTAI